MDETVELLEDNIRNNLESISTMELGTPSYTSTVKSTNELVDRLIEIKKQEADLEEKRLVRVDEQAKSKETDKRDFMLRCAGLGIPILIEIGSMVWREHMSNKLLKFEENGYVSSTPGKNLFSSIFRK